MAERSRLDNRLRVEQQNAQDQQSQAQASSTLLAAEKDKVAKLQQRINQLVKDVAAGQTSQESVAEMQQILETTSKRCKELEAQLSAISADRASAAQTVLELKAKVSELSASLSQSQAEAEELEKTKKELCTQIVTGTGTRSVQSSSTSRHFGSHRSDLSNTLTTRTDTLMKQNDALKERLQYSEQKTHNENMAQAQLAGSAQNAERHKREFQNLWGESLHTISALRTEAAGADDVLEEERRRALLRSQRL